VNVSQQTLMAESEWMPAMQTHGVRFDVECDTAMLVLQART